MGIIGIHFIAKTDLFNTCDVYGGWPTPGRRTYSCECVGFKVSVQDQAPIDGRTVTKCIGFIKSTSCREVKLRKGGPESPCDP